MSDAFLTGPAVALELKAAGDGRSFSGYGAVFGNVDSGRDLIRRGAFAESIAQWRSKNAFPKMLWQHDSRKPIGRWTEMVEDDHGLFVQGRLTDGVQLADEAYALLKDGAIDGLSIGYQTMDDEYDRDLNVRTLTKVALWEVSVVTMPMNQAAGVTDVKSLDVDGIKTLSDAERQLREAAGLSRKQATDLVSVIRKIVQREADDDRSLSGLLNEIRSTRKSLS